MNIKTTKKSKLQLKLELHYKTPKQKSYLYKKGRWTSCYMKSFSSIATNIPTLNSSNRNDTANLKGQLRSICMNHSSIVNMRQNGSKVLVNRPQ